MDWIENQMDWNEYLRTWGVRLRSLAQGGLYAKLYYSQFQ